jgi:hypothetical protein
MARYHGKKGVVYISTSGTGNAVSAVGLRSWTLNSPTDKIEVTAFGDTNKQYVQGLPDSTGDLAGWWDSASDDLYDASRSADGVKLYLYPSSDAPTKYWYGPAWVDFSISTANDAGVEVTASFVANGAWGQL